MKLPLRFPIVLALSISTASVLAAPPVVSNVRVTQRPGTALVDILYDVSDPDGNSPLRVNFQVSADAGATWTVPVLTFSGAVGANVVPGPNRAILWNAGTDWPGQFNTQCRVRVIADDGTVTVTPIDMALVPGSNFEMGDNYGEGGTAEWPVHTVYVGPFYIDRFEVRKALWDEVYAWAINHGYSFYHPGRTDGGTGREPSHPAQSMCWYCAVRWCNARSERESLVPAYYINANHTAVFRSGLLDLGNTNVNWNANGYRLPTEAEWEKAARGGLVGHRYPWSSLGPGNYTNYISPSRANYYLSGDPYENGSPRTTPAGYYNGYQVPAGTNMANGYGLYDVAGNVGEWCWDWYDSGWYIVVRDNPAQNLGPPSGTYRVVRGGSWYANTWSARCANRGGVEPYRYDDIYIAVGFRCVRGL